MNNIMDMMGQLSRLDDRVLQGALGNQQAQVPSLMVMMEMARRSRMRSGQPYSPPPRTTMMQEMQAGAYQPVPTPPMRWPELPGTGDMMGQSIAPQATALDMNQPASMGSMFSQNR